MKKYNTVTLLLLLMHFSHSIMIYNASQSPLIIKAAENCSSVHHTQPKTITPRSYENILNIKSTTVCLLARFQNNENIFQMRTVINTPNSLVSIREEGSEIRIHHIPS